MKKQFVLAVLMLAANGTNSFSDPVPVVKPSAAGAPHACPLAQYYPRNLMGACVQGFVWIHFRIGVDGETKDWVITRSSGNSQLDDAAKMCVAGWRYNPATQNGTPVEITWASLIHWSLHGGGCPEVPAVQAPEDPAPIPK